MTTAGEALPRALVRRSRRRPARPENLWQTTDAVRATVIGAIGAVGLGLCWYGSAGEDRWREQLPWLIGAIAATVVGSLGMVSWLLSGFRALRAEEWAAKREIRTVLVTGRAVPPVGLPGGEPASFVTAPGMTRFHRPACPLVARKPVTAVTQPTPLDSGLTACGVCNP